MSPLRAGPDQDLSEKLLATRCSPVSPDSRPGSRVPPPPPREANPGNISESWWLREGGSEPLLVLLISQDLFSTGDSLLLGSLEYSKLLHHVKAAVHGNYYIFICNVIITTAIL